MTSHPMHLVIFDAMNLLRRTHAAVAGSSDLKERLQHQSLRTILRTLEQLNATHSVAIFDGDQPGWRYQIWPRYKSNRNPLPEELADLLEPLQEIWWQQGIDSVLPENDEADDVIATLACKSAARKIKVTIVSTDQGFFQLLNPNIHQYNCFDQAYYAIDKYEQKFGVRQEDYIIYKAMIGESSSDIPGLKGFGPTTAKDLINHQLDESRLPPAKLKVWQQQQNLLATFKKLVTLDTDRSLNFKLSDIRWKKCP